MLLEADSIVLIDLPPKELLGRLKEGKVYVPHQAKAALQSFFSLSNLTALRELAMQTAASHVEGDLQLQWQAAGKTTLPLRGKLMVCLGDQHGAALVRYGHRFAQRRQLPWLVVHIDSKGQRSPELEQALALASQLGARVLTLSSPAVADALLETAEQQQVSQLLLGKPHSPPWRRSLVQHLLKQAQGFEITLVDTGKRKPSLKLHPAGPREIRQSLLALLIMGTTSAIAWGFSHWLPSASLPLLFVLGVLATALSTSLVPAILAAVLGFVGHNLLFTAPYFSLSVANHSDLLNLFVLLIVGMTAGRLASRQRQQLVGLRETQQLGNALLSLSQGLATASSPVEVLRQGTQAISLALGQPVFALDEEYQYRAGDEVRDLARPTRPPSTGAWPRSRAPGLTPPPSMRQRPSTTTSPMIWCWGSAGQPARLLRRAPVAGAAHRHPRRPGADRSQRAVGRQPVAGGDGSDARRPALLGLPRSEDTARHHHGGRQHTAGIR